MSPAAHGAARYRASSIKAVPASARQWPEHRRGDGGRHHHDGARLQMGGEAALAEQDPRTGGIDHQQHNCIQFRGERHRAGPAPWRAASSARPVVGIDVNAPGVQAPAGRRAAPMPIERPITQTLVCAAMLVSL